MQTPTRSREEELPVNHFLKGMFKAKKWVFSSCIGNSVAMVGIFQLFKVFPLRVFFLIYIFKEIEKRLKMKTSCTALLIFKRESF